MSNAWNFERRRIVCARFLVGVSLAVKGVANAATNLNAVRNRVQLPPEDALFAARRLSEEQLIEFDPGGAVQSTAKGIERAAETVTAAASQNRDVADAARTLRGGGIPLAMLKLALTARDGVLECHGSDAAAVYRLALAGDVVTLERQRADGAFEPAPDVEADGSE